MGIHYTIVYYLNILFSKYQILDKRKLKAKGYQCLVIYLEKLCNGGKYWL